MFENQQEQVQQIMQRNAEFRRLYQHHRKLDKKVHDAEIGVLPIGDDLLNQMKREKVQAKDKLTHWFSEEVNAV